MMEISKRNNINRLRNFLLKLLIVPEKEKI
jgi:hypothetical protein